MSKHTLTPWTHRPSYHKGEPCGYVVQSGCKVIADLTCSPEDLSVEEANAEFIVRAVNNHEALVESAKGFLDWLQQMFPDEPLFHGDPATEQSFRIKDLRAAVEAAERGVEK